MYARFTKRLRFILMMLVGCTISAFAVDVNPGFALGKPSDVPKGKAHGYHGAPVPLMGAGLPLLVLLGGGFFIVRRYRSGKQ